MKIWKKKEANQTDIFVCLSICLSVFLSGFIYIPLVSTRIVSLPATENRGPGAR